MFNRENGSRLPAPTPRIDIGWNGQGEIIIDVPFYSYEGANRV